MKLILASGSKTRKDIFDMLGLKYVMDLSKDKANCVSKKINYGALIIAADTVIFFDDKIYEKPKTKQEAFQNIKDMSGKSHYAITGITIKDTIQDKIVTFADKTEIKFKNIDDKEIEWYIQNEEKLFNCCGYVPLGKAAIFIEEIIGDYNTLFGISPSKLFDKIKELGYSINDFELNS